MITSTTNSRIKHVTNLLTSAKARREEELFVVEGQRIVSEIPSEQICECFVTEKYLTENDIPHDLDYEVVTDQVFKKMSDTKTPQGILCVVKMSNKKVDDFLAEHTAGRLKVLVLESIQDPGNLGTMIRTCEAAGFDGIIANNETVDIYNPKVIRSTMGGIFRVPVMYTDNLKKVLSYMKQQDVNICAAHLKGTCDFKKAMYGNRTAVLIGNEGNGLSDEISSMSNVLVKIPMSGKVESLNAAVAAALMMYEVANY